MMMLEKLYERYMMDEMGGWLENKQEQEADQQLAKLLEKVIPADVSNQDRNAIDDAIVEYALASKKFGFEEGFKLAMCLAMECKESSASVLEI